MKEVKNAKRKKKKKKSRGKRLGWHSDSDWAKTTRLCWRFWSDALLLRLARCQDVEFDCEQQARPDPARPRTTPDHLAALRKYVSGGEPRALLKYPALPRKVTQWRPRRCGWMRLPVQGGHK